MSEDLKKHYNYTQQNIIELCSYEWVRKNDLQGVLQVSKTQANIDGIDIPLEWCIDTNTIESDEMKKEIKRMHNKIKGR